jgi:CRISPR-associated protein Csy1
MGCLGLSTKIEEYIQKRGAAKLEAFDKEAGKKRKDAAAPEDLATLEQELAVQRQELEERYHPANWLSDAIKLRAKQIQLVTHALKFTNSDAKGSSIYSPGDRSQPERNAQKLSVISTASLKEPAIDVVGNAAALDVAALLQLESAGTTLLDCIKEDDVSALRPFARDENQLKGWLAGLKQVFTSKKLSSHTLAKQLYFPIADGRYHLVAPLFSSSLAHALYQRITRSRFDDAAKDARSAKREGRYSSRPVVDFPNTARQNFGGTKPQNVSQLNSARGGKIFLLSCAPPAWKPQSKPPLGVKTVFSRNHFGIRARRTVWTLRNFLEKQAGKPSTQAVRAQRAAYIDELIDQLFQYAAEIQKVSGYDGWSALPECRLSRAEQLWLDPQRAGQDVAFAQERDKEYWQEGVADQFARWLNSRIKSDKLTFGDVEHREWQSLVEEKLRLFKGDLQYDLEVL